MVNFKLLTQVKDVMSHSLTVPSKLAVARTLPSCGENWQSNIVSICPWNSLFEVMIFLKVGIFSDSLDFIYLSRMFLVREHARA